MAARAPASPAPIMTIPASAMRVASTQIQKHAPAFDLDRIGRQIDAGRRALGRAGAKIKAPVMFGAFNDRAHHQSVGEVNLFMRAQAVGGEIAIVIGAVDRESPGAMIE